MKKLINIILMIMLIIIVVWVCYARFFQKEKMVHVFGYRFLIVLTGSMEPEIPMGSFIIIKDFPKYRVRRCYYLLGRRFVNHA